MIPPGGYQLLNEDVANPAPLSPGNRREYHYRFDEAPINQFEITWDARPTDLASWYVWAAIIAFVVLGVAVLVNDVIRSIGKAEAPPSGATRE